MSAVDGMPVGAGQTDDGPACRGPAGVGDHPRGVDADVRRQVGLVDDQEVGPLDAGAALAGDVTAAGDVEHEDLGVDERGREGRGEVVAARLDEHQVERREALLELLDGQQVGGDVVADGGVRAGAGLDCADPVRDPARRLSAGTGHPRRCRCRW